METIKRNSSFPFLSFTFTDENGTPIDCSPFTIRLVVKNSDNVVVINSEIGAVNSAAVWDDELNGQGHYEWADGDTDTLGIYKYEFKFTRDSDGENFAIPEKGFFSYKVSEDIQI